jgi:Tfp pilus assembly protein PilX
MRKQLVAVLAFSICLTALAVVVAQPAADDERRAAVTVMRAINTAENAVKQSSGRFADLSTLLGHPAMARVKANIAVSGNTVTHQGAQVRLALSGDASGYQVMVVPAATCGTAVFSDERGLIYTGKVLDC